ncbi:MAG TPA: hypothetical protein VHL78_14030 [Actinomycetota bacterium]|nr:hypothetical protein [Actinomycetota bacterium]
MASPEVAAARRNCSVHGDRVAIERCRSCGRPVCLRCAVPFRGVVLCTACAARELGEPAPPAPPARWPRQRHTAAAVALSVAALATIPPWDRFGALTGMFSAWTTTQGWTSVVASACLVVAAALALAGRLLPLRAAAGLYAVVGAAGALATVRAVVAAPDYVRHTPAPYVAVAAAAVGVAIGIGKLAVTRRPPPP